MHRRTATLEPSAAKDSRRRLRRRRLCLAPLCNLADGHKPRLPIRVVLLVDRKRVLAHLDVRPWLVVVEPSGDVAQAVAMRDDGDVLLGAGTEPVADPARTGAERFFCGGVEAGFGGPVGGEGGEVDAGVLGVGFEDFPRLSLGVVVGRGYVSIRDVGERAGLRWGMGTYRAGVAW